MRGYAQNKLGELPGMSTLFLGFLVITVMRYSGEDKSRFVAHSVVYNFPIKFQPHLQCSPLHIPNVFSLGVHFVLSCITGTTTNSHGAQANPGRPPVRIGIAFVVNYSPNPMCDDDILTAYLTNMGFDVATEVSQLPCTARVPVLHGIRHLKQQDGIFSSFN